LNANEVKAAREKLPSMFRPQKQEDGRWRMARYSARAVARLRRATIQQGRVWPYDVPKKEVVWERMFKGHKEDREAAEKLERIRRNMERMPEIIAAYRREKKERKAPKKEGLQLLLSTPRATRSS